MREYTKYRGYYMGPGCFHSKEEIDKVIKDTAIRAYKLACECFAEHTTPVFAAYCDEKAEVLVNEYGMDWEELDAIEIEIFKNKEQERIATRKY
jgi:hypothetical protein